MPRIVMSDDDDSDDNANRPAASRKAPSKRTTVDSEDEDSESEADVSSEEASGCDEEVSEGSDEDQVSEDSEDDDEELEESDDGLSQLKKRSRDDVVVSTMRPRRSGPAPPAAGARVLARFKGKKRWYPATVREANADGTFAVDYEDGDFEESVRADHVKPDTSHMPTKVVRPPPKERISKRSGPSEKPGPSSHSMSPASSIGQAVDRRSAIDAGTNRLAMGSQPKKQRSSTSAGSTSAGVESSTSARLAGSRDHAIVLGDDDDDDDNASSVPTSKIGAATATAKATVKAEVQADMEVEEEEDEEDDEEDDNDLCDTCGEAGDGDVLLCCDGAGCKAQFHLACVGLKKLPKGDWFCVACGKTKSREDSVACGKGRRRIRKVIDDDDVADATKAALAAEAARRAHIAGVPLRKSKAAGVGGAIVVSDEESEKEESEEEEKEEEEDCEAAAVEVGLASG
eukprot:CAMPEP_0174712708 /NCGR_PEP_ID=MMETSP1094-20130205/13617_1 /TAXON_ID=156173 /ORGANISM="Chrysochromulina brevifilum, Strain UTEX LB 985" /LENGTH=456 /DNA_ID=CAMNT_0015911805 /DNA_START=57 /DNA_END=1423 /DNA_ORIENTATION=-